MGEEYRVLRGSRAYLPSAVLQVTDRSAWLVQSVLEGRPVTTAGSLDSRLDYAIMMIVSNITSDVASQP
jgi:hypothetical protein